VSVRLADPDTATSVHSGCAGAVPLQARLEPWQLELCSRHDLLAAWIDRYGSPLNIINPAPLGRNADELSSAAALENVDLKVFFARKANKALTLVDEARISGLGIDVASERELAQVLDRDVPAADIVVTAAVKPRALLEMCVSSGVTVVIDNEDELTLLRDVADDARRELPVAFRLAPETLATTRFGLAPAEIVALVDRYWPAGAATRLAIRGLHFHLDGYEADDRLAALGETLEVIDTLRERGHRMRFVDIGGGVPMSYLDDAAAWDRFWSEHCAALAGQREPLTFEGHGLGLTAHAGEIIGHPNVYPYYQRSRRGPWLSHVLRGEVSVRGRRGTAAAALRSRDLQLRCGPGRSLVDGCGLTAARVEFRKQRRDGTWLIGVAMNRTQCRSTSDDFLVDPLLATRARRRSSQGIEGYLVGAYCSERELLTWRRLRFPRGAEVGDIVVFPNTAGYLMHSLESASHQIPLALNLISESLNEPYLDPIEA
jgi:diaminopimelate decarboxylase